MALWIVITLLTMAAVFRVIYRTEHRKIKITALMALLGLVTCHVHAFLNNYSQNDKIAVPLWTFTAVIVVLDLHRKEAPNQNHINR